MTTKFMKCKIEVGEIIANRIFEPKKSRHPKSPRIFYLVERGDEIVCVWCGNLRDSDRQILCIYNPHMGYTSQQWDAMTINLQRHTE